MSEEKSNFSVPYKVLTVLGLWSVQSRNPTVRSLYGLYQTWVIFYLLVFIVFCFADLYFFRNDVQRASTNLTATMTVFMLMWKNSLALRKHPRISAMVEDLRRGLHVKSDDRDREILLEGEKEITRACYFVYALAVSTMTFWLFSPLIVGSPRELPLPVWVPWDHRNSPYYELAYIYHVYGGYLVAVDVLSLNLTIFGTIVYICMEYDILQKNTNKIRNWYESLDGTSTAPRKLTDEENVEVEKMLALNIRHHQKIIHAVEEAENCYVHMMLVQYGGSALLVTVVALDLILVSQTLDARLVTLIILFTLVSTDICLFCLFGSRLMGKSDDYVNCIYRIPWETMNQRNRKSVSIMILKAQRSPKLTIEKIANIDLYTLVRLGKVIYNLLYLLLHLAGDRG